MNAVREVVETSTMVSDPKKISIAKDFSRVPAGRFRDDGPFSGEAFRRDFLLPELSSEVEIEVDLDGTEGYGSSFLEEAFGGLVREGLTPESIFGLLALHSSDRILVVEVKEYIRNAAR